MKMNKEEKEEFEKELKDIKRNAFLRADKARFCYEYNLKYFPMDLENEY